MKHKIIKLLLMLFMLYFSEALDSPTNQSPSDNYEINNTFKLLEEGEKKIELSEQHKNITLVIGNTGDGKSTFIQWMAGDDGKLVSEEVGSGTSKFIIEDGNNRIGSSSNSKTIFPELVVDKKTNAAYYDCPGFGDSRSTSYDIASTYFIKKITDHANHVKIVLVTGYPSVSQGVDRQGFIKLLKHTTDLIKNIGKFENSIAIVVTKVDNNYIKKGRQFTLVSDIDIIRSIADFLQAIKKDLHDKLGVTDAESKEKLFINDAMRLIDILCAKNNEVYSKIGIFRRPDEAGPLSKSTLLQEGKENIEQILLQEISFTKKNHNDFGYTISDKSKYDVNILVERINDKVWFDVFEIADKVQEHYRNLVEEISTRINSFKTAIVCVTETEAQVLSTMLNTGYAVTSSLWVESKNLTSVAELANITKNSITRLGISTCDENLKNISEQGKYFSFLQLVSDKNLKVRPWSDMFHNIKVYISHSRKNLEENVIRTANEVKNKIKARTTEMANEIKAHYLSKIESLEFKSISTPLNKGFHIMSNLTREINNINSAQLLSEKISDIIEKSELSSTIARYSIFCHGKYLGFLKILNNGALDDWSSEWIIPFNETKKFLYESEKWYSFLEELYTKLSEYDIQKDKIKYNVDNINEWGVGGKSQGIKITKENFRLFLEKIKLLEIKELDLVRNIEVTSSRLQALNDILRHTLGDKLEIDCSEYGNVVIKGNFIRLSELLDANGKILDLCGKGINLKSVDVFALDTIFIDGDLRGKGSKLQVSIFALKWQIQGLRIIDLDGASGASYATKAKDGWHPGGHGRNGQPGQPGGAAGNFFGIGKFINGKNLTITASGGEGGTGQQGGDGKDGSDGESARISDDGGSFINSEKYFTLAYNSVIARYRFYGKRGGAGGSGGQGGRGGMGGTKGEIKILNFDSGSPSIHNIQGSPGKDGKGGIGGVGGRKGYDLVAYYCKRFVMIVPIQMEWCNGKHIYYSGIQESSGANGNTGGNTQGLQLPEQSKKFQTVAHKANNYKFYLRKKLQDNYFRKNLLMEFVNQLENNIDIKTSYDTLGLVRELLDLEKQFQLHQSTVDFMPFYQSLLNRTHAYAQRHLSNSDKKATSYLTTATLSKISTLKTGSEANLMTDLENYLQMVKENINSLNNFQEKSSRINVINQYKQSYKIYIDKKVDEVEYFIKNQITDEIDNIIGEDEIDLLVNETIALQDQGIKEQLVQKKRELEKALTANWLLHGLKNFGQLAGCLANLGAIVSSAVDLTNQVPQSLSMASTPLPESVVLSQVQKFERFKKMLEKTEMATSVIGNQTMHDERKKEVVKEANTQVGDRIQQLQQYTHEKITPMLRNVGNGLNKFSSQLSNKTQAILDVSQWQVQSFLKDIKSQIRKFTKGFTKFSDDLAERLEEAMTTLINIYDRIQNYQEQTQLAAYMADVNSPVAYYTSITNKELGNAVKKLEMIIISNLVLEQYKSAVNAIKQHVFPFAQRYLAEIRLPSHLQLENDLKALLNTTAKHMDVMQSKIKEYKTAIKYPDTYLSRGWFNRDSTQPFFVWENNKYSNVISNLLSGEKVVVMANIHGSALDKDVIKFNEIGISFYSENSTVTSEISNKLKGFTVSATHLGNSYYRYNDKIYIITGDSQNIINSFEKDAQGEPVHKNSVYEKIKNGDLMLSPYAMWEFQLINATNLTMYKDQVDLELVGYGSYVTRGAYMPTINIENYYHSVETISLSDLCKGQQIR